MKKVIYIITTILLCMTSCTDIHDTYSEYIKDGEQIYVGKLADVKIHPGFQRMMIKGSMKYLATAKTCIIELVGYDKVFTTDIDRTQPEFSYEIKDVEEGNYYVKITTKDKEGNTSLSETYNVDVYGTEHIATYYPKRITDMQFVIADNSLNLIWNQADNVVEAIVKYYDSNEQLLTLTVKGDAASTNLPDWKATSILTVETRILPSETALDIVSLPISEYTLPDDPIVEIPRTNFANANMPSDVVNGYGGSVEKLWNNDTWNYDSGYHAGDNQGVPHHLTIDMGLTATITECELFFTGYERTDWMPRLFQIWGIEDVEDLESHEPDVPSINPAWEESAKAKGWKQLTTKNISVSGWQPSIKFACDKEHENIRYIRYRIVESLSAPHVGMGAYGSASEIKFWGKKVSLLQ
ncbi:DUF4998 domain-containing protein [Bacteroides faecis]|uniref:DUF4998 domain-containing protein n=1 Tax=Bacteroides faecis TaxID=674529 RepID=UPI000338670F|nr:putative chitobiase [Bacteroides faecis CAG:32]